MTTKLITTFRHSLPDFITKARNIKTCMSNNPNFQELSPDFMSSLGKLPEIIDRLQVAHDESSGHDTYKIAFRDKVRKELVANLGRIAKHAELSANGDVNILQSTGFDLTRPKNGTTKNSGPLKSPFVKLRHGKLGGTMNAGAIAIPGAGSYEGQITDGDPTIAENWRTFGIFVHCKSIDITGLTAGRNYSVRLRAIGVNGVGAWSPHVTLMSL